jgi:hypothetical protein
LGSVDVGGGSWNLLRLIVWAARFRFGRCSVPGAHRVSEVIDADHLWVVEGGCLLRFPK